MAQYEDIKQKINNGLTDRQIAKAVGKRRSFISEIRKGLYKFNNEQKFPLWMNEVDWDNVIKELGNKHSLSFIWEDSVKHLTSYPNFTRYLNKKFPQLKIKDYTHRQFNPGERVEVDWAGLTPEWIDPRDGKIHKAFIFVGCLGYSQLIFAKAYSSMKEIDFLSAHEAMFEFYNGVTEVICPDNTKTAVIKANKYDPDLNEEYNRFTKHYGVTVAPARVYSPKDKSLVEGSVKLVQRYFNWITRKITFTSIAEINKYLKQVIDTINNKSHSRFKISRQEMFNLEEKNKLKALPAIKYELSETKFCKVHPDGTICINLRYYSVPYLLVGKTVFVKIYAHIIEIYHETQKIAVHPRLYKYKGEKSILSEHTPVASQVYRGATVQNLIQQANYIDPIMKEFIEKLLKENPTGNIRRAQGFIIAARQCKKKVSSTEFKIILTKSLTELQKYNQVRVETFKNYIKINLDELIIRPEGQVIHRDHSNPMLRKNQITLH